MMDMHEMFWSIKKIAKNLEGNICEAHKYARMAHEWKDKCKMQADWYRDMAQSHLNFNAAGKTLYEKRMADLAGMEEAEMHIHGIKMAYDAWMRDVTEETAEVQALLSMYK